MLQPSKDTAVLCVENMSFSVDNKEILKNINFSVNKGEFIGIIGQNGAGKSTLLKCIRGFLPVTTGDVFIYNEKIKNLTDRQIAKKIAFMQQEVRADFGYSALQIVLVGRYPYLEWWQNESAEDIAIAKKSMNFTGVTHLSNMPINLLSGGERQRVLFAKVITQQTDIMLLDEPTANLDLVYQEELFAYCRQLAQQGKTILVVAHDLKMASKFCSRLILLADGRILADGKPSEVITNDNLAEAYGLSAMVFTNKVTGQLDLYTYTPAGANNSCYVHIIGGGGSACSIIRAAFENGLDISTGVLHEGDTDTDVAHALNTKLITVPAFSQIGEKAYDENRKQIENAGLTILANVCYGLQNIKNLEAAFYAKKLIIVEDTPFEERDYTNGKAKELYDKLCNNKNVSIMTSKQCVNLLKNIH